MTGMPRSKRAAAEGWRAIELTAITEERFDALERLLEHKEDACGAFERVTIHAPGIRRTCA